MTVTTKILGILLDTNVCKFAVVSGFIMSVVSYIINWDTIIGVKKKSNIL